jgi:hypothetical protein
MAKPRTPQKSTRPKRAPTRTRRKNPVPTSNPEGAAQALTISHEEIAARAYALFLARGGQHGDDWSDWFRAEAGLRRERWMKAGQPPGDT